MRVNVSYTAELEEVPTVVQDLCVGVGNRLESLSQNLKGLGDPLSVSLSDINLQEVYLSIEYVRRELNSLDIRLQDTQSMVEGLAPIAADPEGYVQRVMAEQERREQAEQAATTAVVEEVEAESEEDSEQQ
jgi:hypothetical protein